MCPEQGEFRGIAYRGIRDDTTKALPLEQSPKGEIGIGRWQGVNGARRVHPGKGNSGWKGAGVCVPWRYSGSRLMSWVAGELGVSWLFACLLVVVVVWEGGDD